ncbi:MAG: hypothetical protein AB7N71_09930 [Phycisphaerae bacterium]
MTHKPLMQALVKRNGFGIAFLAYLAVAALPIAAQPTDESLDPQIATEVPSDGFFPTPRMIELIIDRATGEMSKQLEFDSEQLDYVRTVVKSRIPQWLQLHKAEIKTLSNQYFEAILDENPPTGERVSAWSDRVLPLVDGFQQVLETSVEDMAPVLTEDQMLILEGDMAALRVGISFVRSKLELWREGGYDPEVDWPHGARFNEMERAEQQVLTQAQKDARAEVLGYEPGSKSAGDAARATHLEDQPAAKQAPTTQPVGATDEFDRYVEDFIRHYQLNAEQTESAGRFLREAKRQRDRYQTMKVEEFRKVEARLSAAEASEIPEIRTQYEKLRAPIERYFQQLKDRLDKLPTRAQRKAAAQREVPTPESGPAKG